MKATLARSELFSVLSSIHHIVERHDDIPILNNTLIRATSDALTFFATDRSIEVSAAVGADVKEIGAITVPAKSFYDFVRRLPKDAQVSIETSDKAITIKSSRSRCSLRTLPEKDFPVLAAGHMPASLQISSKNLSSLLGLASVVSADEQRVYLQGVYLHMKGENLRAVATNGHSLAQYDTPAQQREPWGVIIPRRTAIEVCRLLGEADPHAAIMVEVSTTRIRFSVGLLTLTSKLIDGKFPDYERIIPSDNNKMIEVDREELEAATARVAVVAGERGYAIRMDVDKGLMRLTVNDPSVGSQASEELDIKYDGPPIMIGFNSRFFNEILNKITGDVVIVKIGTDKTPMLILGDDATMLHVLMPMSIQ